MRRGLISILTVAVLATAGLVAGCSGGGGRPAAESPSSSRSADVSAGRSAGGSPSRSVSPRERDSAAASPSATAAPSSPGETATKTVESTATRTVTRRATQTETQTTTQPAAQPVPSAGSESEVPASGTSSSTSSLLWLWILLAVFVVVGIVVYLARRRSRVERDWNAKLTDACAQGAALHDAIIVAEMSGLQTDADGRWSGIQTDADGRWSDIQRRADGLNQALYVLRATAPAEEERLRVDETLAALQAVRLAITPQGSSYAADRAQVAESIQGHLRAFDNALRALRGPGGR